ncbi:MBL fold metallo-hydrolase [soil metagenome]
MRITYVGTASVLLEYAGLRIITDPVFDEPGQTYSMAPSPIPAAWFASTRTYSSPITVQNLGAIDVALISHDHHSDNLDAAGRALVLSDRVAAVVTNPAAAHRLSRERENVLGLWPGSTIEFGAVSITATPARHGPTLTPQASEVTGFLLEAESEPSVWISGDTVLTREVRDWAERNRGVGVAIINAGGVRFPAAPLLGRVLFTFDPPQFREVADLLEPRVIVPVHRSGWSHFQPEDALRAALADLGKRVRWLDPGQSTEIQATGIDA